MTVKDRAAEAGGDEIRFERVGRLGIVTLDRPRALNALTLGMIRHLDPMLASWAHDHAIEAVAIRGAGEKAFCAGGDVRAVYEAGRRGTDVLTYEFFFEEYRLNQRIHRYAKPYVALIDGIAMGGGLGLSVHGRYRVVTERTMMAMPETAIGLFPRCRRQLVSGSSARQDRGISRADRRAHQGRGCAFRRTCHPFRTRRRSAGAAGRAHAYLAGGRPPPLCGRPRSRAAGHSQAAHRPSLRGAAGCGHPGRPRARGRVGGGDRG